MPEEEPQKTSRIEHVRAGEGESSKPFGGKKLPPWAIGALLIGGGILVYYIWKKNHEKSAEESGFYPAQLGGSPAEYGGYGGQVVGGSNAGESTLIAFITKQEEEANKRFKEELETSNTKFKTWQEGFEKTEEAKIKAIQEAAQKKFEQYVITSLAREEAEQLKRRQETANTPAAPAPSLTTQNPPNPAPITTTVTTNIPKATTGTGGGLLGLGGAVTEGATKITTGQCSGQYPYSGPHGCYRNTTGSNGCTCHLYRSGLKECQHKTGGKCVW